MSLNWIAGPWIWETANPAEPHWRAPQGFIGLDARTLAQQSQAGGSPGLGVFVGQVPVAAIENRSDYGLIGQGSWYDIQPSAAQRSRLPSPTGFTPRGSDLVGMILSLFTDGASPDGTTGPKPIVPTMEGRLELHCGQKHFENFRWGGFHTAILKQQLRLEFAAMWQAAQAGQMRDAQHPRRVLDFWMQKYGVADWKEFVPLALQSAFPGPLPHETTITESFDQADSTTMGPTLTWSEVAGDWNTTSNKGTCSTGGTQDAARAESDLSSADHYAQVVVSSGLVTNSGGPSVRFNSAAHTYYRGGVSWSTNLDRIQKFIAGTATTLASQAHTVATSTDYTMKITANGSSLSNDVTGTATLSTTDTSITSNLRTGISGFFNTGGTVLFDTFQAADLAASGILYTQLERSTRGILRGMYTRFG